MKILKGYKVYIEGEFYTDKALLLGEKIESIVNINELDDMNTDGYQIIEGNNHYLLPGFIDIHIHGAKGHDVMDGSLEGLSAISQVITQSGVTAYLATTMTMEHSVISRALDSIKTYINEGNHDGAEILGVHLEGPFINPAKAGAQDKRFVLEPKSDLIKDYLDIIKMITIAPEMDHDFKFIKEMTRKGIGLSIGHSDCSYDKCKAAYKAGVKNITHCFNAMRGFNHREPGVVGAALNLDFNTEIIPDLVHTHEDVLDLLYKVKGHKKINIVTDSMMANYMPDGIYELGGQRVDVENGTARLEDGTIAGSVLKMNVGLKNYLKVTGARLEDLLPMLTENPARTINMYDEYGSIDIGKKASFTIVDEDLNIVNTMVKGKFFKNKKR